VENATRSTTSILAATALFAVAFLPDPATQAAPPEGWSLVFSDEFAGDTLDTNKWGTEMAFVGTHGPRYHNEYYASYTVDRDVIVSDGILRLRTDRQTVRGKEGPGVFEFTQGLVSSHDKFSFTHGYIEIRAKFPAGKGLWPCFWLMPAHQSWPPEFDIAEFYGGQKKMHHGLAHGTMGDPKWDSTGDTETDFVNEWHTIALEWSPGRAVWFVDGVARKTVVAEYVPAVPMYVILSNSVSSGYGPSGEPDEHTIFPNHFEIDYVRIYQPRPAHLAEAPAKPKPVESPAIIAILPGATLP
jgi:beta-glucanase (GH16 family)